MNSRMKVQKLQKIQRVQEIQNVQAMAREKLVVCGKLGEIVGTQIFEILNRETGGKNGRDRDLSLPLEDRVWEAGHELFNVWFSEREIKVDHDRNVNRNGDVTLLSDRFAAAFLADEGLVFQEMRRLEIGRQKLEGKEVLRLANRFVLPYQVMVKRMYEIRACTVKEYEKLQTYTDAQVESWRRRLGVFDYM